MHILSCRCRYMCRYICRCTCRCGCIDVHMQIVLPYASVYRTRVLILNFRSKRLLVVFTTVRLLKSPLNTKISKPRQNRCLRVIRFTRKRSNQRKITSKHRSYRLQSPVNRKFEAIARRAFCFCPAIHLEHCTCVSLKKHKEVPDNVGQ